MKLDQPEYCEDFPAVYEVSLHHHEQPSFFAASLPCVLSAHQEL